MSRTRLKNRGKALGGVGSARAMNPSRSDPMSRLGPKRAAFVVRGIYKVVQKSLRRTSLYALKSNANHIEIGF